VTSDGARRAPASAKLNLALVVGPRREDGKHEVVTVLQRLDLGDRVAISAAPRITVTGYAEDTLVRQALEELAAAAGVERRWAAVITKRVPVAAGLGGGSSDAATALRLANLTLTEPLPPTELHRLAVGLGADVPFFLTSGPQLGLGDGSELSPLELPQDYWVLLVFPRGARKESTAAVYQRFDERGGADGWDGRRSALDAALAGATRARRLAELPPNDLASSPLAAELVRLGAFRADVTGAGPTVYGLFLHRRHAEAAQLALRQAGRTWLTVPTWYG
jgi:4-diphosphocytidyl-2-C-methyl-D-erythritol kinase